MIIRTFNYKKLVSLFRKKDLKELEKNTKYLFEFLRNNDVAKSNFFYHPLGFIYSELYTSKEPKEIVRLHIWDQEFQKISTELDIHTHYYEINSFVIKGQIVNEIYNQKADNCEDSKRHFIYEGEYLNNDRILKKTDSFLNLVKSNTEIIKQNTLYKIELNTFHRAFPLNFNELTITIVFNENHQSPNPIVLGEENLPNHIHFKTKPVESVIIEKLLNKIQ